MQRSLPRKRIGGRKERSFIIVNFASAPAATSNLTEKEQCHYVEIFTLR